MATDMSLSQEFIELTQDEVESIFSLLPDLACIASADGYFRKLNPLWEEIFGHTVEELLNSPCISFVHPEDIETTLQECGKIFSGEPATNFVNRYRCKDGSYRWLEWRTTSTRNNSYILATARDITENRRAGEGLEITGFTVDNITDAVFWAAAADGHFWNVNQAACKMLGYTREELLLLSVADVNTVLPREAWQSYWDKLKRSGNLQYEVTLRTKDGRVIPVEIIANYFNFNDLEYSCSIVRDFSERKRTEQEMWKYRLLFDRMLNGFAICEIICNGAGQPVDFRYLEVNPAFERNTGLKNNDVTGRTVLELLPETESYWIENFGKVALSGEPMRFTAYYDELDKHLEVSAFSLGHGRIAIIFNDVSDRVRMEQTLLGEITERKNMEKALRESEELFRTLCDSAPIGIFKADCAGRKLYNNPRLIEIYGLTGEECLENDWYRAIHPDDRERIRRIWQDAAATRRPFTHEYRLLSTDGETSWARALVSPIKSPDGEVTGYVGTVEEITELRQAREEMQNTQKLESLGVLAGGIAHDFNNILTAILGNISLSRMQMHDKEKTEKRLAEAENAAFRARDLTQQLLTFARGGEPVKKVIEAGALLKEAAGFAIHGSSARCEFSLPDGLWPVEVDEGQLSQVIHNLVINAVQSMPDGGTITIGADNISSIPGGQKSVRIYVADNGAGIEELNLQRIFDPYFTTKQHGSGLGLATCYSIIKKHGGTITVESTVGKGSTFYLSLPASQSGLGAQPEFRTDVAYGIGRVLIMDDEEPVRDALKAMLEELGYTAECVRNGAEAVDLFRQKKEEGKPFAAVILDLTIPGGVGGKEAITALRKIDPKVKAVVSSGYSTDPVMANYREFGFSAVLSKPYLLQDLSMVFQELLTCG
jgi:PAS domain S-box-containing protein